MKPVPGTDTSVLMVAGMGRSGSTVLGDVLGTADRTVHVGELVRLPRMLRAGRPCDCGRPLTECPVWRGAAAVLAASRGPEVPVVQDITWPADPGVLCAVYAAVAEATRATTIVDGSKHPAFVAYASDRTDGRIGILHLVRDARGVVHSRVTGGRRHGLEAAGHTRTVASVARDAARWVSRNAHVRRLAAEVPDALLLRYEDFAADPEAALDAIAGTFGTGRPAPGDDGWACTERHCVWGNRGRGVGTIRVRPDVRWHQEMPRARRELVSAVALPGLLRYGYLGRTAVAPQLRGTT